MKLLLQFFSFLAYILVISYAEKTTKECDTSRDSRAFETMVKEGSWTCALQYITATKPDALLQLKTTLDMEQRRITASIAELKSAIEAALPTSSIVPAFQWCQSTTHIYMNIKFSHKLDAPATLNVETDDVTITDSHFHLSASAVKGSSKNFKLDLPLWAPIVPANSSYSMASVGRMSVTFMKEKGDVKWPKLVPNKFNVQKQLGKSVLHFWHEQHEKYAEDLDLLDDEDDDEDDKRRKIKARKEKAKQKDLNDSVLSGKAWSREESEKKAEATVAEVAEVASPVGENTEKPITDASEPPVTTETNPVADRKKQKEDAKKLLKSDHEAAVATLEAEVKKSKRDADFDNVATKKSIDDDATKKKKDMEQDLNKALVDLDGEQEL